MNYNVKVYYENMNYIVKVYYENMNYILGKDILGKMKYILGKYINYEK